MLWSPCFVFREMKPSNMFLRRSEGVEQEATFEMQGGLLGRVVQVSITRVDGLFSHEFSIESDRNRRAFAFLAVSVARPLHT